MKVLASFSLPAEIKHREQDPKVQARVFSAMEHKRDGWGDFEVKIGGYVVCFTQNDELSGYVSFGEFRGYYQVAYRGFFLEPLNMEQLAELKVGLRRLETSLNAAIQQQQPEPDFGKKFFEANLKEEI